MTDFLKQNVVAVFGLVGVLVGAILAPFLNFLSTWAMRRRDLSLKLWERFLDRRITAHETVINLAIRMRGMMPVGGIDSDGGPTRAPVVMESKQVLDQWLVEFGTASGSASTWLSTPVTRELNFVQDYFVTLHTQMALAKTPSDLYLLLGSFVRQDFIDLSRTLEKTAFQFFESEATKLRLSDHSAHHKYALEETKRRLKDTVLLSKWAELQERIRSPRV